MLVLIGARWLTAEDSGGKRLDHPDDYVIAAPLKRKIPVTPVLVQGARIPDQSQSPDDLKDLHTGTDSSSVTRAGTPTCASCSSDWVFDRRTIPDHGDCAPASTPRGFARDLDVWFTHLGKTFGGRARGRRVYESWADEDVYVPLGEDNRLLERAGFAVDVPWRRSPFAVIVGYRRT